MRELSPSEGWKISGTTRDHDKKRELREQGIKSYIFDFDVPLPDPLFILGDVTHLLISIPPDSEGDPCFNQYLQDIIELPKLEWVGYLSTTGAYGDRNGGPVDETSEARPSTKRGSRRWKAEQQWLSLFKQYNIPVHIFRLAGIYGPGRSALDSIRAGLARRIDKPGHAFNRIHVEDIAQVIKVSMENPKGGEIYNICDDYPAPSHEVIDYACQLIGIESPPLIPIEKADLAPITLSFYKDNKRVKNDKIKNELGVSLKYPTYKDGLRACLEAENQEIISQRNVV
tara:strand:+ start:106 stop:960 length:855 start_codon:yes stop_codon:yes gene_type:complete